MLKFIVVFLLLGNLSVFAQSGLRVSGKLRTLEPIELRVVNIEGQTILLSKIESNRPFSIGPEKIVPDVYFLCLGETKQAVYLTNTEITIKGYYDSKNPNNSSLEFTGINEFLALTKWLPIELDPQKKQIAGEVKGKLQGNQYSVLAYLADMGSYEPNKMLLDLIPDDARNTLSAKWLIRRVDSLSKFMIGAQAYDFEYVNQQGKKVRLSDYRGKLVLIDFWASWCGPCRQEMKSLLPIYNELKGDDLEFISISLDNKDKDWRKMLEEEKLPWVMLWNEEGFTAGNAPNIIQGAYGFYSIPFIVLINKDGRIIARGLRGEKVKEVILEARGL